MRCDPTFGHALLRKAEPIAAALMVIAIIVALFSVKRTELAAHLRPIEQTAEIIFMPR